MSKEKFIVVNSKDRNLLLGGQTNSDFTVSYKDNDMQQVLKCIVKDVFIPNQFYNINVNNNELRILGGSMGLPENITITPGQYNIDQLIDALKTAIDNELVTDSVTITKDTITNILTFTTSANLEISLSSLCPVLGITTSLNGT